MSVRHNVGATHTEGKLYAQLHAEADQAPNFNPDKAGTGIHHVALLERAIGYSARDHRVSRDQFKQLLGWS